MAVKASLFTNGRSQAVRIPKDMAFRGVEAVFVEKHGKSVVLTPVRKTWQSLTEEPCAAEDFMRLRPRLLKPASAGDV